MPSAVLDASALLAYLRDEHGAEVVSAAIASGASISTVNLAGVLGRAADRGTDPARLAERLTEQGLLDGAVSVEPFTAADAVAAAALREATRARGLSLGDRACLALAGRLEIPAFTADTAWARLELAVDVRQIR